MLFAEDIVHVVEVEFKQLILVWRLVGRYIDDRLEVEDLSEDTSFSRICTGFLEVLGLVLIQLSVQEELLFSL